jgi:preprotein translocase subunit YajC
MCGSPPAAVGTVKSVGDNTFTLTTADGSTVTVDVGSSTTYVDPGVSSPTFANVTVGEHVAVMGTKSANTVTATNVLIGLPPGGGKAFGPGGPGGPPAAVGTVKSVGSDSFTLTTSDGSTVTVHVSSSTKYMDPGVSSPSLANVTVGEHVAVIGTESSNTVTATSVLIGVPPRPPFGSGSGSSSNNTSSYSISGGFTTA